GTGGGIARRGEILGREGQERVLAQPHRLLRQPGIAADARAMGLTLDPAQRRQPAAVAQPARLAAVALRRGAHSSGPWPVRGGKRLISPRCRLAATLWVKLFTAAYSARKRSSTAASRIMPLPSKAVSS